MCSLLPVIFDNVKTKVHLSAKVALNLAVSIIATQHAVFYLDYYTTYISTYNTTYLHHDLPVWQPTVK